MKQMIAIVACGLFCFTSGLYLGVQKANDRVAELGEKYKETDNKVAVFTDLNDPKTVLFYVSELNKIVDNMHRLGKIIDKGEEVDLALARIEKQYHILGNKIDDMVTIKSHKKTRDDLQDMRDATVGHIDDMYMEMEDIEDKLNRQYKAMIKSIDMIENEVSEINDLLKTMNKKKFFHTHK